MQYLASPLAGPEHEAARHLLSGSARATELLERASNGTSECIALGAIEDDALAGVILFGEVAGAVGTGSLLWIAVRDGVRRMGTGRLLVEAACERLRRRGVRLIVAEVPGSAAHQAVLGLALACGFRREAEVADYFCDGVPLLLLRRDG